MSTPHEETGRPADRIPVTVRLDPALARRLRVRAAHDGVTLSSIAIDALRRELDERDAASDVETEAS